MNVFTLLLLSGGDSMTPSPVHRRVIAVAIHCGHNAFVFLLLLIPYDLHDLFSAASHRCWVRVQRLSFHSSRHPQVVLLDHFSLCRPTLTLSVRGPTIDNV